MSLTKVTNSMQNSAPISVLDYDVDPTGATDSAAGLQAAIDAATSAKKKLVFPAGGFYRIASTLTFTSPLVIDGEMCQILQETANTDALMFDEGTAGAGNYQNAWDVRNLVVRTVAGTGNAFTFRNINESKFTNLYCAGVGNIAFYIQGCLLNTFEKCYVGNGFTASPTFFASGASGCVDGFRLENYNSLGPNTNTFMRCTANNATGYAYYVAGTGNTFIHPDAEGITSPAVGMSLNGIAHSVVGGNFEGTGTSIDVLATNCTIEHANVLGFLNIESGVYGTTVIGGNVKYLNFISGCSNNTAIGVRIGTGGSLIQNGTNNTIMGLYNFNTSAYVTNKFFTTGNAFITSGSGSPEGVLVAAIGSLYTRTDGGAGTTLYVKESGASNTGWIAK